MNYCTLPVWYTPAGYQPGRVLARWNQDQRTRSSTPLPGVRHGTTTGYAYGCGCEPCRAANREAQRQKRARHA